MEIKESWTLYFAERQCVTVYTRPIVGTIVRGDGDPAKFAYDAVAHITWNLTQWFGSHDDGSRRYVNLEQADVSVADAREWR